MERFRRHKSRSPTDNELGTLKDCFTQGQFERAEALSTFLTGRYPNHGFAWKILGAVYQRQSRYGECVKLCDRALRFVPEDAAIYNNRGTSQMSLGNLADAEVSFRKALGIRPHYAIGVSNLGMLLRITGRLKESEAYFRLALSVDPVDSTAKLGLARTLEKMGKLSEAQECYRHVLTTDPNQPLVHSDLLFLMSLDIQVEPQQLFAEHLAFGERFETPLRADWSAHPNPKDPHRCLQIGFVSGDLYDHAVASFLEPVLEFLAQKQSLSLHAYYTHTIEDSVTLRLKNYFAGWHAVNSLSDAELANKVRADGIDILIDLSGHTAHNRLLTFARKPAPIQATWLGYPGTTGLQAMDYHLCDRFFIPPGELDWQFTEKSAFLPASAIFQPCTLAPEINVLPALANGFITFGSFNRINKLNPSVIALWAILLRNIPDAQMLLGAIPEDGHAALVESFALGGIDQSRLTFLPRSGLQEYLALHHRVDICLDTFPYGGGTTTAHAAWMGVPTLTLAGETAPSRSGATFMNQLGLNDFIATDIDDFAGKGLRWSNCIDQLAAIRQEMRARFHASAMGQPKPFADSLEVTLRTMWQRWCIQLPPATIDAPADSTSQTS